MYMRKQLIIVMLIFVSADILIAQDNPREQRPAGLSLYIGGPTIFASASFDVFLSPNVNFDVGGGLSGIYAGGKYHFKGHKDDKKWTFYSGLVFSKLGGAIGTENLVFFPVGYNYIDQKGFDFSVEALVIGEFLAGLFFQDGLTPYLIPAVPGLKFGYRF